MKLGEIDVDELVRALGQERSAWIRVSKEEGRRHTDAENVTMCVLVALEHALGRITSKAKFEDPPH